MNRYAHLWFLIGLIISAATAVAIWALLAVFGSMLPVQAALLVATIEAIFLVGLYRWLTSSWRFRRRLHEKISRELRCRAEFPSPNRHCEHEHSWQHC